MFNRKILAASMAAAITTGGMVAQSHALEVTNNDVGQVLLAPVYYAENGYDTNITITNTRTDAAVKAKVVFRSHKNTDEVIDFMIYLSPTDVWRGKVEQGTELGENGLAKARIVSSDDSMRNADDDGWADADPVSQHFFEFALSDKINDSTTFGHIEVIAFYAAAGTYSTAATGAAAPILVEQGMSKDNVKLIFDRRDANLIANETDYTNCMPADITTDTVSSISPCAIQLMSEVIIGKNDDPNRASMRMTALGTDEGVLVNDEAVAELTYVMTNPTFTANTSDVTDIGRDFGSNLSLVVPSDNIVAIETALSAAQTSYEYETAGTQETTTLVTFPTRYRHYGLDHCATGFVFDILTDSYYSPPFNKDGSVTYTYTSLNNSEQGKDTTKDPFSGDPITEEDTFKDEVNYHHSMVNYVLDGSGWAKYVWAPQSGPTGILCSYAGMPVIAYSYKFKTDGGPFTEALLQKAPNTQ